MSKYVKKIYGNINVYMDENLKINPTFCPICGFAMRNIEDKFSFSEYECCNSCENKWVYRDIESWKSGKKPSSDEINKYVNEKLEFELSTGLKI